MVGGAIATVKEWGELSLFGVADVEETDAGYLLSKSGNHRLALVDRRLNLLGTKGRRGEGPVLEGRHLALVSYGVGRRLPAVRLLARS